MPAPEKVTTQRLKLIGGPPMWFARQMEGSNVLLTAPVDPQQITYKRGELMVEQRQARAWTFQSHYGRGAAAVAGTRQAAEMMVRQELQA